MSLVLVYSWVLLAKSVGTHGYILYSVVHVIFRVDYNSRFLMSISLIITKLQVGRTEYILVDEIYVHRYTLLCYTNKYKISEVSYQKLVLETVKL